MPKAYVLLSGGIDSSTCLAVAARDWDGRVCAVSVKYGQRHTKEIGAAQAISEAFETAFVTRDITGFIQQGGLTDAGLEIPPVAYDELPKGVSPTYVPFRNGTLLSLIAGMAAVDDEAEAVYFGAHAEDAENWAYPDCTPEFIGGMSNAIYVGTYHQVRLYTPLMFLRKDEVITLGTKLRVPWELTWSCYEGKPLHCGKCPTCRARAEAFHLARVPDPTEYATHPAALEA